MSERGPGKLSREEIQLLINVNGALARAGTLRRVGICAFCGRPYVMPGNSIACPHDSERAQREEGEK
jgi:hypothetical protein